MALDSSLGARHQEHKDKPSHGRHPCNGRASRHPVEDACAVRPDPDSDVANYGVFRVSLCTQLVKPSGILLGWSKSMGGAIRNAS